MAVPGGVVRALEPIRRAERVAFGVAATDRPAAPLRLGAAVLALLLGAATIPVWMAPPAAAAALAEASALAVAVPGGRVAARPAVAALVASVVPAEAQVLVVLLTLLAATRHLRAVLAQVRAVRELGPAP